MNRLHTRFARMATALEAAGYGIAHETFDTIVVEAHRADELVAKARTPVSTSVASTRTA